MAYFRRSEGIKQEKNKEAKNDLAISECEETIIRDKLHFGIVRDTLMEYLLSEYGKNIVDKTLLKVNNMQVDDIAKRKF